MRLVGVCTNCGTSVDSEMIARGPSSVTPFLLCSCTGGLDGLTLTRTGRDSTMPSVIDLVRVEVDSDAP